MRASARRSTCASRCPSRTCRGWARRCGRTRARSRRAPPASLQRHSIWPAIFPRLLELIRAHRSTIVFVNSRRLAERVAAALNELAGEEIAQAHHGSIAREQRVLIEDRLKAGQLAGDGRDVLAGAGHRHGRRRSGGPDRDAALGRERPPADRAGRAPGRGRLARASSSPSSGATSSPRPPSPARWTRAASRRRGCRATRWTS